ncbi:hypothetical protein BDAP_001195 [Binucleata daphniae]
MCKHKTSLNLQKNNNTYSVDGCFCLIEHFLSYIECEYEAAMVIVYKDDIFFFKDELGRKSLTYDVSNNAESQDITISSVGHSIETSPHYIYKYNTKNKLLSTKSRNENNMLTSKCLSHFNLKNTDSIQIYTEIIHKYLSDSIIRRLHTSNVIVLFSGGVDSLLVAVLLHMHCDKSKPIYLINTMFGNKKESHDRKICKVALAELTKICTDRTFILIKNDVDKTTLDVHREHIEKLIHPKRSIMDFNIGACLWFSARAAKEYGKIVYAGCGADELFCGYKNHKDEIGSIKARITADIKNLWDRNLGRDDRVIADNNVEPRFPFLDLDLVNLILNAPDYIFIDQQKNTVGNKTILRQILANYGFVESCNFAKKAMQFGSGINQYKS